MDSQTPGTQRNRTNLPRGMENRIIVVGGRGQHSRSRVFAVLDATLAAFGGDLAIIHDGGRGASKLAAEWCEVREVIQIVIPAQWNAYGEQAGALRNREMFKWGVKGVIAFPGGTNTGDMITVAKELMVPVRQIAE